MYDAITDVPSILVGQAGDPAGLTGCTVVLCPDGAVVGVDVRGRAPGTRETDLCRPGTLVSKAHAILLTGGSAFGLSACEGVVRFLAARDIGFDTGVARVPIVPAAVIFDLGIGAVTWPDADMAERACIDAADGPVPQGNAGAGWGATVGKLFGPGLATKAGQGTASLRTGGIVVAALMVVNAVGDVVDPQTGEVLAGARAFVGSLGDSERRLIEGDLSTPTPGANTTIGVVATNAALTKEQANYLADVAHDGLARAIRPAHTILDGDTIFVLATGAEPVDAVRGMVALGVATVRVVERAVVAAVTHAVAAGGLPAGRPADHPV